MKRKNFTDKFLIILLLTSIYILTPVTQLSGIEVKYFKKITTGSYPKSVELSPDGKLAAIMNLEGCSVWFVETENYTVIKKINFQKISYFYIGGYNINYFYVPNILANSYFNSTT